MRNKHATRTEAQRGVVDVEHCIKFVRSPIGGVESHPVLTEVDEYSKSLKKKRDPCANVSWQYDIAGSAAQCELALEGILCECVYACD